MPPWLLFYRNNDSLARIPTSSPLRTRTRTELITWVWSQPALLRRPLKLNRHRTNSKTGRGQKSCITSSKMAEKIKSWGWNEPDSALRAETAPSYPPAASGPWGSQERTKVRPFLNLLAVGPHAVGWEWLVGFSFPPFPKCILIPSVYILISLGRKKKKLVSLKKTSLCFAKCSSSLGRERGWLALSPRLTKLLFLGMCSKTGRKQMLRNKEVKTANRFFTPKNAKRKHDLFSCV